jgi:general secretion pathway protein N
VDEKPLRFPPATAFASVESQPLFNEDRKPTPIDASEAGGDASDAPQSPLNVTLTGVVSTSSVKIAMVQDKTRNQSVALKVGMPLEGDQANWTLVEVKPRSVVFRSAANERTEIELETSVAKLPPPPRSTSGTPAKPANARDNQRGSADLAKRIEERRKQMREDAEKLRNKGGNRKPPQKPVPPKH